MSIVKSALNLFGIKNDGESEAISLDDFLGQLPALTGFDVSFEKSEKEDGTIHYEVVGPEADSFVSENSNMLDALAHISMRILRKQMGLSNQALGTDEERERIRVNFDCGGFREKKVNDLQSLAEKARSKVIDQGGKPFYIPALSPSERKSDSHALS